MKQFFGACIFAVLLGVAFAAYPKLTPYQQMTVNEHIMACRNDISISDQDLQILFTFDPMVGTGSMEKMAHCFLQRIGVFEGDTFLSDVALQKVRDETNDEKLVAYINERCNTLPGMSPSNLALRVFVCYFTGGDVIY